MACARESQRVNWLHNLNIIFTVNFFFYLSLSTASVILILYSYTLQFWNGIYFLFFLSSDANCGYTKPVNYNNLLNEWSLLWRGTRTHTCTERRRERVNKRDKERERDGVRSIQAYLIAYFAWKCQAKIW